MVGSVPGIASALLALLFAWAGMMKAVTPPRWRQDLEAYRLPRIAKAVGFVVVPWSEISIALMLLTSWRRVGAIVALVVLTIFSLAIVRARILQGTDKLSCGCFGGSTPRDYRILILRNLVLGALSVAVLTLPVGGTAWRLLRPARLDPIFFGTVGLAAIVWTVWQADVYVRRLRSAERDDHADVG